MPNPDGTPTALEQKIAEVRAKAEAAKVAPAPAPVQVTPAPAPAPAAHTPEQIAAMPALPIPLGTHPASPIPMGPSATPVASLAPATVPLAQTLPVVSVQAPAEIPALEKPKARKTTKAAPVVEEHDHHLTSFAGPSSDGVRVTLTITGPASELARILAGIA